MLRKIKIHSFALLLLSLLCIDTSAQGVAPSTATFPGNITVNSAVTLNQSSTAQAIINNLSASDGNSYMTIGLSTTTNNMSTLGIYSIGSLATDPIGNNGRDRINLIGCDPTIDDTCATGSGGVTGIVTAFSTARAAFSIIMDARPSEGRTNAQIIMHNSVGDQWLPIFVSTFGIFTVGEVSMGATQDPNGSWQYGGDAFSEGQNDDNLNGSSSGTWDWGSAGSTSSHNAPADWWFLSDTLGDNPVLVAPFAPTNSLLISSNGYVGIGTAAPTSLFQVGGGTFAIDAAGHMLSGGPLPTVSICGGGAPHANPGSNMIAGKITVGTAPLSSCTITWPSPFPSHVSCQCNDETTAYMPKCVGSKTALHISGGAMVSGDVFSYSCVGF